MNIMVDLNFLDISVFSSLSCNSCVACMLFDLCFASVSEFWKNFKILLPQLNPNTTKEQLTKKKQQLVAKNGKNQENKKE